MKTACANLHGCTDTCRVGDALFHATFTYLLGYPCRNLSAFPHAPSSFPPLSDPSHLCQSSPGHTAGLSEIKQGPYLFKDDVAKNKHIFLC